MLQGYIPISMRIILTFADVTPSRESKVILFMIDAAFTFVRWSMILEKIIKWDWLRGNFFRTGQFYKRYPPVIKVINR